ncbi:MAG: HYR domain-containing protein [Verrucomicrobiota bacterium]
MNKILDMTLIKNGWLWAAGLAVTTLALPMSLAKEVAQFETFSNVNMASAGIGGLRRVGSGTIQLAGVSGTVTKALLYWHGPISTLVEIPTGTVLLNGNPVTGTSLGLSSANCWPGYSYSEAFRADVTQYVPGNGSYAVSDFNPLANDVNGASLIVFFNDGNDSNNRDYVVFDGNDSNNVNGIDADGWNAGFPSINYVPGNTVSLHLHVSDGQIFEDAALILNGATLVPAPAVFSGDSVPIVGGGTGPFQNGGLWDIRTFELSSFLSEGPNQMILFTGQSDDCFSLVVGMLDLPVGATSPPPPPGNRPATVDCPNPATVEWASPSGTLVTLTATVHDLDGDALKVTWKVNGVQVQIHDIPAGNPPTSASVSLPHTFTADNNLINVTVTDLNSPPETCAVGVTFVDTTPPTVDCGAPITVEANQSGEAVVPDFKGQLTMSDNRTPTGSLIVTQEPLPGTSVGVGNHTVTVTVADTEGNSRSCYTLLTVTPAAPSPDPVSVDCGVGGPMLWPPNHKLVNVGFTATAINAVGPVQIQVFSDEDDVPALGRDDRE